MHLKVNPSHDVIWFVNLCVWGGGGMEFFSKTEKSVSIQMNPVVAVLHPGVLMQWKGKSQNQPLVPGT